MPLIASHVSSVHAMKSTRATGHFFAKDCALFSQTFSAAKSRLGRAGF